MLLPDDRRLVPFGAIYGTDEINVEIKSTGFDANVEVLGNSTVCHEL